MGKYLQYARVGLTVGIPILWSPTYINKYIKHPEKYPLEVRWARIQKLIRKVLKAFRVDITIEGKENLPTEGRYLAISNHLSTFDALTYIAISDKPVTFAAKEETLEMPFVGKVFKALNGVALDRKNVMNQLAEIKQIVNQIKIIYGTLNGFSNIRHMVISKVLFVFVEEIPKPLPVIKLFHRNFVDISVIFVVPESV